MKEAITQLTGLFQSTLPVRGATTLWKAQHYPRLFQSTLPVRGATIARMYIRTPAEEFQSTLPVRGATIGIITTEILRLFQSTLPVRGATAGETQAREALAISIHAPRKGSDGDSNGHR